MRSKEHVGTISFIFLPDVMLFRLLTLIRVSTVEQCPGPWTCRMFLGKAMVPQEACHMSSPESPRRKSAVMCQSLAAWRSGIGTAQSSVGSTSLETEWDNFHSKTARSADAIKILPCYEQH